LIRQVAVISLSRFPRSYLSEMPFPVCRAWIRRFFTSRAPVGASASIRSPHQARTQHYVCRRRQHV